MTTTKKQRLVVIDGLNLYLRNFIVNSSVSTHGNPVGGIVGTLGSLRKIAKETAADKMIICWDGPGGSLKRRQIVKEYKEGRKPIRKNYEIEGMDEQSEKQNRAWQQITLSEIINNTPIIQLTLEGVEADDIISYVCRHPIHAGMEKVIVSSDKDFIQLLDDETVLFRPIQKEVLTKLNVLNEYGISPENFVTARAIAGDVSDNLVGVKGAGLKTIAKRLPFLAEHKFHGVNEVISYCKENVGKVKFFNDVADNDELVHTNFKIMNLLPPSISPQGKSKVDWALNNFTFDLNVTELKKVSIENGFASFDWSSFAAVMRNLENVGKTV
jgi:5'-3' exonuclease